GAGGGSGELRHPDLAHGGRPLVRSPGGLVGIVSEPAGLRWARRWSCVVPPGSWGPGRSLRRTFDRTLRPGTAHDLTRSVAHLGLEPVDRSGDELRLGLDG